MKQFLTIVIFILGLTICSCDSKHHASSSTSNETSQPERNVEAVENKVGTVQNIVAQIEAGNRVESSHIGIAGSPSSQWDLYKQLKNSATTEQLIDLTDHRNGAVKCYAFHALASKRSDKLFPVLLKHLYDTSTIETQSGCIVMTELVGDYFLNVVTPNYIDLDVYKLNESERRIVDSILVNDKSILLYSKSSVLQDLKPTLENYNRIRELVIKDRNQSALITLAKYKKNEDKKLISSFFADRETQYSALFAVREYPDQYFFPFVKKAFEQEWEYSEQRGYDYPKWRMCYQALAKYPNPETLKMFERTLQTKDEFRYNTLCTNLMTAITKYPNKLYDHIKQRIRLPENYLNDVKEQLNYENEL
jgi:hypothetical protein